MQAGVQVATAKQACQHGGSATLDLIGVPDVQHPPNLFNVPKRAGPQQPGQPEVPQPATTPESPTSPMPAPQPPPPMPQPIPPQA
jgi:hypothetical protein